MRMESTGGTNSTKNTLVYANPKIPSFACIYPPAEVEYIAGSKLGLKIMDESLEQKSQTHDQEKERVTQGSAVVHGEPSQDLLIHPKVDSEAEVLDENVSK